MTGKAGHVPALPVFAERTGARLPAVASSLRGWADVFLVHGGAVVQTLSPRLRIIACIHGDITRTIQWGENGLQNIMV